MSDGLAKTARVITAAAAIMVVVFLAFVTRGEVFLSLLGIGMATATGRANWWMPRWLDRAVPRLAPDTH